MAGREKKQLGNKQPAVKKEAEKVTKGTELQKQDDMTTKTKDSRQKVQKDVNSGKKPTLTRRSTGANKSARSLASKEIVVKNNSSDSKPNTKRKQGITRSSQVSKLRQSCKIDKTSANENLSNSVENSLQLSSHSKPSQNQRLSRSSKITKREIKTSEETTNLNDDSISSTPSTRLQNAKLGLRSLSKSNKLGPANIELRNGTKGRNAHYLTRSDSPARILRNGKRRKLKDPSLLEGLDLGFPKRRRLLSTTRDGSGSELGSKSEPILDDQSSIAGSDLSFIDSPRLENGKANWEFDCDSKPAVDVTKSEVMSDVRRSVCSVSLSETSTDNCLGKSISNKIAELINRNKLLESVQKGVVSKQEGSSIGSITTSKSGESKETSACKVIGKDKSLTDTNSNVCDSETVPSKKIGVYTDELANTNSVKSVSSENRAPGTKEQAPLSSSFIVNKKVNTQDVKELGHKNGQNPSIDKPINFTDKFPRKIRDLKVSKTKPPRLFQALHSTSGMFYVVQNTSNSPFHKQESKSGSSLCNVGRRASADVHMVSTEVKSDSIKVKHPENISAASVQSVNTGTMDLPKKSSSNVQTNLQLEESSSQSTKVSDHAEAACSSEKKSSTETVDTKTDSGSRITQDNIGESMDATVEKIVINSTDTFENNNNDCLTKSEIKEDSACDIKPDFKSSMTNLILSDSKENISNSVDTGADTTSIDSEKDFNITSYRENEDCKYAINSECLSNTGSAVSFNNGESKEESNTKVKESENIQCLDSKPASDCNNADNNKDVEYEGAKDKTVDVSNIVTNFNTVMSKNIDSIEVGTVGTDENLSNIDKKIDCESTINKLRIFTLSLDTCEQSVKVASEQVVPDYESDSSIKSIRRSSRSSLDKTRAAVMNCLKSKRSKSKKLSGLEKNQGVDKDECESQSSCITEDDSTMDSTDIFLTEKLKNDCNDFQAGAIKIEKKPSDLSQRDLRIEDPKTIKDKAEPGNDVSTISESTTKNDVQIVINEDKKDNAEGKNEESSSNITSQEPVKICAEPVLLTQEMLNIPGLDVESCGASDITDFTIVDSATNVGSISDASIEPVKKEENESIIMPESRQETEASKPETKSSLESEEPSSENAIDMLKEDEKDVPVSEANCFNLQIGLGIKPALFYNKESPKNKFPDANNTAEMTFSGTEDNIVAEDTAVAVSTEDVKNECSENKCDMKDDCSESKCDSKNDSSENKSDYEDKLIREEGLVVTTGSAVCSDDSEDVSNKTSFSLDVFQDKEDVNEEQQNCMVAETSIVCNDDSNVQEELKKADIVEIHQEEYTPIGKPVEINIRPPENDSKMTNVERAVIEEEVNPEEQAIKESVLSALGLQPLRVSQAGTSVSCNRSTTCSSNYTGTLKTVIKLQRSSPEKRRTSLKLVLKHGKAHSSVDGVDDRDDDYEEFGGDGDERIRYSICKETDVAENSKDPFEFGIDSRKSLKPPYSYRYFDVSSKPQIITEKNYPVDQQTSDPKDDKASGNKQSGNLVIPEKSSSFSIHPGRLCNDVCSYCFGKFGSLDTPCHIAQLKNHERQQKILEAETHLTADSCLCDACYRHVDRKANCPSYKPNKKRQYQRTSTSQIKTQCCVQGCTQTAHHHVRRKWLIKLKRSIAKKVPIDMEKMPQHLPFPLCSKHYSWVDYFMVCGICKRRLTRNHMYPLGPEVHELNTALANDGIPVRLSDKLFLCKLCRYFASVRLKYKDPSQLAGSHKLFFQGYRKRILHFHDIEEADDETAEEAPPKSKRRKTKTPSSTVVKVDGEDEKSKSEETTQLEDQLLPEALSPCAVDFSSLGDGSVDRSGASTPMIDYSTLGSGNSNALEDTTSHKQSLKLDRVKPPKIKLKLGCADVGKNGHLSSSPEDQSAGRSLLLPERDGLEVTPLPDSIGRPFYPGEDQLPLHATFDFHTKKENAEENKRRDWEKCTANIQFDKDTKSLFQHLQRPYGNHSSFFRHLILLEKYWRSGELMLSPSASTRATTYFNSVQNRIHAYEGRSSSFFPHYSATLTAKSIAPTAATQATPVPVIDLPLKRRLGGGILTATDGASKPITITSVPSVSVSPQPMSFTPITASVISPCHSRISAYTTFQRNPSSPAPRKVLLDATSTGSHIQTNRRIQNVLQVMAGGKSFSIIPGLSQIRHIHSVQQHQQQKQQPQQSTSFEPMICDVRSLATENGSGLWDRSASQNSSKSQSHQQSITPVTLLPKTSTSSTAVKPSTIVTPTGIILSRKPEISVTAVRDVGLKSKVVSSRKESIPKLKTITEKLDIMKTKAVLEKKDTVLQTAVPELKGGLSNTKC